MFFAAIEVTRMPMILTDPNLPDNPVVFANCPFQDLTGYQGTRPLDATAASSRAPTRTVSPSMN
jgi:hypothetical protein